MSCKKPVLLAINGVSRKLIEEANCGIYVEPEKTDAIVTGVLELLNKKPSEIDRMGLNGYLYAKNHFDRVILAKEYIKEIQKIV